MQPDSTAIANPDDDATPRVEGAPPAGAVDAAAAPADMIRSWRSQLLDRQQWRRDAATEVDYYDGNQFDAETILRMRDRGLPILPINNIRKPINGVIGLQERNLTDFRVTGEETDKAELYDALSARMKVVERMTSADGACLDAFSSQVKAGLGWVEVGWEQDPFKYPIRVMDVPWREMDWDRAAKKADFSDATYFRRSKFYPRAKLIEAFPAQAELIRLAGSGNDTQWWNEPEQFERGDSTFRDPSFWSYQQSVGDMVMPEEYWYKVSVSGYVVRMANDVVRQFDEKNPQHLEAYYRGLVQPKPAKFERVRVAFWLGPHRIIDRWSPLPHNEFPYVPFVAYIEERTGVPYGLIRDMRYLQDEINTRRSKMAWGLNAVRMIADVDAFNDVPGGWQRVQHEIARADAVIFKNRGTDVKIDEHGQLNEQQYKTYLDAQRAIQDVAGTPDPFLGDLDAKDQSGIAQQTRIDQTITTLGKINRNYRTARQKVGQLMFAHLVASTKPGEEIAYEDKHGGKKVVQVNRIVEQQDGSRTIDNNLMLLQSQVTLDEVPSTPTLRANQFQEIARALSGLPPDLQSLMMPVLVEASEWRNRKEIADMLRKKLGLSEPTTPEEVAAAEREAQKQALVEHLQMAEFQAKVEKLTADSEASRAKAEKTLAEIQKVLAEVQAIYQDMKDQATQMAEGGPTKAEAIYRW